MIRKGSIYGYFEKDDLTYWGSKDLGLLTVLLKPLAYPEHFHYQFKFTILNFLQFLADQAENKVYMGSRELGLTTALSGQVSKYTSSRESMAVLESLSSEPANRVYMASKELGLVSTLVGFLQHPADFFDRRIALEILVNLCKEPENRAYIRSAWFLFCKRHYPPMLVTQ